MKCSPSCLSSCGAVGESSCVAHLGPSISLVDQLLLCRRKKKYTVENLTSYVKWSVRGLGITQNGLS